MSDPLESWRAARGTAKIEKLRQAILMLADGAHRPRITGLLRAFEEEATDRAIAHAARIVQVHADDAATMFSSPTSGHAARVALEQAVSAVKWTDSDEVTEATHE